MSTSAGKPVRLLYLRDTLTICGPGKTILNTWRTLDRERYHLIIAATRPEPGECNTFLEAAERLGAPARAFAIGRGLDIGGVARLVNLIRTERIDVLQTHDAQTRRLGVLAAALTGIRHISSVHGWIFNDRKELVARWIDRHLLRMADAVIVVSDRLRQELVAAGVPEANITLIRNAIMLQDYATAPDGAALRAELGIPAEAPVISIVGRLSAEKGHVDFLSMAATLLERFPETRFLIIGDGPMRDQIAARIAELDLQSRVILTGHQNQLAPYYAVTTVLGISSYTEGIPNVMLEAFACGKPAVATAVGGVPEVLEEGRTGFLVEPGKPEQMVERLSRLLADASLRDRMGKAARRSIEERYSFDVRTRALTAVYEGQLGLAPSPSDVEAR
ncbi:MAG: glycosyltransferase [Vicinamibacterales bacterium]